MPLLLTTTWRTRVRVGGPHTNAGLPRGVRTPNGRPKAKAGQRKLGPRCGQVRPASAGPLSAGVAKNGWGGPGARLEKRSGISAVSRRAEKSRFSCGPTLQSKPPTTLTVRPFVATLASLTRLKESPCRRQAKAPASIRGS